jgi:hypothetical protein
VTCTSELRDELYDYTQRGGGGFGGGKVGELELEQQHGEVAAVVHEQHGVLLTDDFKAVGSADDAMPAGVGRMLGWGLPVRRILLVHGLLDQFCCELKGHGGMDEEATSCFCWNFSIALTIVSIASWRISSFMSVCCHGQEGSQRVDTDPN